MPSIIRSVALFAALATLAACGGGGDAAPTTPSPSPTPAPVASVVVSLGSSQLIVGGSTVATAETRSSTGASLSGRTVTWSSSDPAVASVSGVGAITALSTGTTTITATSEGRSGSATLSVIPVPVASITVALAQPSLVVGSSSIATATVRSATGDVLTGRTINWESSNATVATVNAVGVITALAPGTVSITAISEGRSGSAVLTVTPLPIATVTLSGSRRVKVGDAYSYSAIARLADGTVVQRPVTWSVAEPQRAAMMADGTLTPTATGAITVEATIDGVVWVATVTAYDWLRRVINGSVFETLEADLTVTNRFGESEYPELTFVCSATGNFFAWVSTRRFITENGVVALSFDGEQVTTQVWDESDDFSTLFKPGLSPVVKSFALQVASARRFGFAFGEFRGPSHATLFRVTGLPTRLAELFTLCPSGNPVVSSSAATALAAARADLQSVVSGFGTDDAQLSESRRVRATAEPSSTVPAIGPLRALSGSAVDLLRARRR